MSFANDWLKYLKEEKPLGRSNVFSITLWGKKPENLYRIKLTPREVEEVFWCYDYELKEIPNEIIIPQTKVKVEYVEMLEGPSGLLFLISEDREMEVHYPENFENWQGVKKEIMKKAKKYGYTISKFVPYTIKAKIIRP